MRIPFVLLLVGVLVLTGMTGCSRQQESPPAPRTTWIDASKLVDLTHPFDSSTIYWPTNQPFRLSRVAWGTTPGGWWYASNDYSASEHGGTHTDAPIHFHEGGWTVDQIPLEHLIGPAVILDVRESCRNDPDYTATDNDLATWEKANGPLPDGAIVILRTGWEERWPDRLRYLGSDRAGDASNLHFPGFSEGLARKLTSGGGGGGESGVRIAGAGLDTPSLDPGISKDFRAHQVLSGANVYGLENLMNLAKLPPKGATLIALPMKIAGGTGGPTRVIAVLP